MKHVLEAETAAPGRVVDRDFIDVYTDGFEELREHVTSARWEDLEKESGISREADETGRRHLRGAHSVIACWAMGLTQHRHGVANVARSPTC
jgi:anaerobic selenocysteine-containing dehydrogenase